MAYFPVTFSTCDCADVHLPCPIFLFQMQHELSYSQEQNRMREFLLQEQEKENCRELERAQESERTLQREKEQLGKQKVEVEEWLARLETQLKE